MDQAVQDGIAEGGVFEGLVPVLPLGLADDQSGLPAMSIPQDLEEITTLRYRRPR